MVDMRRPLLLFLALFSGTDAFQIPQPLSPVCSFLGKRGTTSWKPAGSAPLLRGLRAPVGMAKMMSGGKEVLPAVQRFVTPALGAEETREWTWRGYQIRWAQPPPHAPSSATISQMKTSVGIKGRYEQQAILPCPDRHAGQICTVTGISFLRALADALLNQVLKSWHAKRVHGQAAAPAHPWLRILGRHLARPAPRLGRRRSALPPALRSDLNPSCAFSGSAPWGGGSCGEGWF